MNFIEELRWRGMLHDTTPGVEEHLKETKRVGYIGFDPTAPSLTIGNFVQIMLLKLFQLSGHQPIVLLGGATGRIGDPSGKDQERQLKDYDELDTNLNFQKAQCARFLDFEAGPNPARFINNLDFYQEMNVLDFLRKVGKTLTVNYMMTKESVKKRIETGISFTEFSYQLLQGYDYQCLFQQYGCTVQMGGSDQWGNITSGTEFIRRNLSEKAYAVTTPLLTKADGSKFGKSAEGNIWLDPKLTSPYRFYQFWINADDQDMSKFIRYFTLKSREEVEAMEKTHENDPQALKRLFAEELTVRVHSQADYESVLRVSNLLFGRNANKEQLAEMSTEELKAVAEEIPSFSIPKERLALGVNVADLLTEVAPVLGSKSEVRNAIKGNALMVNKDKVASHDYLVNQEHLLHGKYLMVENGKKNKYMLVVE
ncbi:MAG TPA: tyrosine--tRNA ligase [Saprospiraceae bacterium]|nr:tyrosine--tRNA ligase [Saprospiraceae bacterium]HMQ82039.1 tyrosine--tRNA ligase [Saprospiraceae bacterium]